MWSTEGRDGQGQGQGQCYGGIASSSSFSSRRRTRTRGVEIIMFPPLPTQLNWYPRRLRWKKNVWCVWSSWLLMKTQKRTRRYHQSHLPSTGLSNLVVLYSAMWEIPLRLLCCCWCWAYNPNCSSVATRFLPSTWMDGPRDRPTDRLKAST